MTLYRRLSELGLVATGAEAAPMVEAIYNDVTARWGERMEGHYG